MGLADLAEHLNRSGAVSEPGSSPTAAFGGFGFRHGAVVLQGGSQRSPPQLGGDVARCPAAPGQAGLGCNSSTPGHLRQITAAD